jgi:DNA uptake protein ComE-like DNA-binding protein
LRRIVRDTLPSVAPRANTRKGSQEDWLLDGQTPRGLRAVSKDDNAPGRETRQWLAVPAPAKPSEGESRPKKPDAAPRQPGPRKPLQRGRDLASLFSTRRDRGMGAKLRRAQRVIKSQSEEIEELRDQVDALESELEKSRRKAARAKKGRTTGSPSRRRPSLNTVTFEQLRKLGLTPTQSARVIAYREANGRYSSFEELSKLRGISEERIEVLRDRLREPSSR